MADFNSVESVLHCQEAATILEVQAFLYGEYRLAELPLDRDLISESYIEYVQKRGELWDDPDYLRKEPETCFGEAQAYLLENARGHLKTSSENLGDHYPFDNSKLESGVIYRKENVTAIGTAYIWLKLFLLSRSDNNYLQLTGNLEAKKFNKEFQKVFEYLAIFAVSGKYRGVSWMSAPIRGAAQFLVLLEEICGELGHGTVKALDQLTAHQLSTNDGRIDAVHITQFQSSYRSDSEIYLMQATTQKKNLRDKVVKFGNARFFDDFFIQKLNQAKHGILVVPYEHQDILSNDCAIDNCIYFPLPSILNHLGSVELTGRLASYAGQFSEKFSNINVGLSLQKL